MSSANVIELEIDGPCNENQAFLPLGQNIRGSYRWYRAHDPMAAMKQEEWGECIPGQLLGVDLDQKQGYIHDRLRDEEHKRVRKVFENKKLQIPDHQRIQTIHLPTWLLQMKRAVESGVARFTPRSVIQDHKQIVVKKGQGGALRVSLDVAGIKDVEAQTKFLTVTEEDDDDKKADQAEVKELKAMVAQVMEQNNRLMQALTAKDSPQQGGNQNSNKPNNK